MSVRKSLVISFAEKYAVLIVSIASTMVLARLLTPEEIGIFSVSVAVVGIVHMIRDFGVTQYLVVEEELTKDRIRAAFGITIVISWSIGAALFLAAGSIADFYNEPGLVTTLSILSINFLLIPFGNPVLSLLRRDMAFGTLFWINTATSVVRETTAVTLAFLDFGFMSLVWGSLASVATTAVLATFCRPSQALVWPGFKEWRRVFAFGAPASATAIVSELGVSTGDLVIGKALGFAEVGLYSRALGLINLFQQNVMSAVRWVALPAFAASKREGRSVVDDYLKSVSYLTVIAWPFYGMLFFMAGPIVRILFGDQWDMSIPLVRYLAVAAAIGAFWSLASQAMMAGGLVQKVFVAETVIQFTRIGLVLVAVFHGLEMVAASQIAVYAVGFLIYQWFLNRHLDIAFAGVLRASFKSFLVATLSLIGPSIVVLSWGLRPSNIVLSLAVASVACGVGWLIGIVIFRHPIKDEVSTLFARFRQRKSSGE